MRKQMCDEEGVQHVCCCENPSDADSHMEGSQQLIASESCDEKRSDREQMKSEKEGAGKKQQEVVRPHALKILRVAIQDEGIPKGEMTSGVFLGSKVLERIELKVAIRDHWIVGLFRSEVLGKGQRKCINHI